MYDSFRHARHSIRLDGFDYRSDRLYFVTICTQFRFHFFGDFKNGRLSISPIGRIIRDCWRDLPNQFSSVLMDEFVVMPNHIHGIVRLVGAQFIAPGKKKLHQMTPIGNQGVMNHAPTLGSVIRHFKAITSRETHRIDSSLPVWQRNYYERIIRKNGELEKTRQYIRDNPKNWDEDPENV